MRQFFELCDTAGVDRDFNYDNVTTFFQWYVAGDGDKKLRAHTTLPQFLSAWGDYCAESGQPFPFPGTRLRRRINRFKQGLKNRFPHEPRRTVALCLDALSDIAAGLTITSALSLWNCSLRDIFAWGRFITAHDALLRPVEHSAGCRWSDVSDNGDHLTLLVGSREREAKYKNRPRRAVLPIVTSHLSAGYVLRVMARRLRRGAPPSTVLFPAVVDGVPLPSASPWKHLFSQLRAAAARIGLHVRTGRCLRAGGTTDLFAQHVPSWWIKRQGGWGAGDAFLRYNCPTPQQRADVARVYSTNVIHALIRKRRPRRRRDR